jgi:hypothetical protein
MLRFGKITNNMTNKDSKYIEFRELRKDLKGLVPGTELYKKINNRLSRLGEELGGQGKSQTKINIQPEKLKLKKKYILEEDGKLWKIYRYPSMEVIGRFLDKNLAEKELEELNKE